MATSPNSAQSGIERQHGSGDAVDWRSTGHWPPRGMFQQLAVLAATKRFPQTGQHYCAKSKEAARQMARFASRYFHSTVGGVSLPVCAQWKIHPTAAMLTHYQQRASSYSSCFRPTIKTSCGRSVSVSFTSLIRNCLGAAGGQNDPSSKLHDCALK